MKRNRNHRRRRRTRTRNLLAVMALLLLLIDGLLIFHMTRNRPEEADTQTPELIQAVPNASPEPEIRAEVSPSQEEARQAAEIYLRNAETLLLVNKNTELSKENAAKCDQHLQDICEGIMKASTLLYDPLVAMLADAAENGYEYWIASAYRSRDTQKELLDAHVASLMQNGRSEEAALEETLKELMPAGYSEHETGLALDLITSNNPYMDSSQEKEPGNRWLQEHCTEYGFVLRYPKDKEDVTQIDYEPWHFRYVGREAAEFMQQHELCLEEFIEIVNPD